jgi:hypothetical protein
MPTDDSTSLLDRVWNRLDDRYDDGTVACDCAGSGDAVAAFEESALTRADVAAYRQGDASMDDLVAAVDVDLDPATVDDLADLADALAAARTDSTASSSP